MDSEPAHRKPPNLQKPLVGRRPEDRTIGKKVHATHHTHQVKIRGLIMDLPGVEEPVEVGQTVSPLTQTGLPLANAAPRTQVCASNAFGNRCASSDSRVNTSVTSIAGSPISARVANRNLRWEGRRSAMRS